MASPHSNCRAEIAVKTAERIITDNTQANGGIDIDKLQRAILQYRTTPHKYTNLSPAMIGFSRSIKNFTPMLHGKYKPHPTWKSTLAAREEALSNRHMMSAEYWTDHTEYIFLLVSAIM